MEIGVTEAAVRIHTRLRRYLEAQYHIRDESLIRERRALLEEAQQISTRPFLEVTPTYAGTTGGYSNLTGVPPAVKNLLQELSGWDPGVGVFPPFTHQAEALEAYFGGEGADLLVATGTGSGKTEVFLNCVLGKMAQEASERPDSFVSQRAVRALLLYPMNALVSDQTARLRRFLGDERLAGHLRSHWGRHPQFGMYTSRTPYPGKRSATKDGRNLDKILGYYQALAQSPDPKRQTLVKRLRALGRWPAKDIVAFYGKHLEAQGQYQTGQKAGKTYVVHNWEHRLLTQKDDRELLTRHEMQLDAPDLLITNYSMLEYMLLRPIERSIFKQTADWLASDPRNQLLLVLDEAHMYRGVAGAEVGFLIRRLMSRLGIDRSRLRCILTSASLGSGATAEEAALTFAHGLTGETTARPLRVIRGTLERRAGASVGTPEQAQVLAQVPCGALASGVLRVAEVGAHLLNLARAMGWPDPPDPCGDILPLRLYAGQQLTGFGPLEQLITICTGNATELTELAGCLFPTCPEPLALKATEAILALGTFARRTEPNREEQPILPTRVHLMFRGLPSQYVCLNPQCSARRVDPGHPRLAGRMFTSAPTHCACGARTYELLTHRDCGASYLRVFYSGSWPAFLWHEAGGHLHGDGEPLKELHLLLEPPGEDQSRYYQPLYLDLATGRVVDGPSGKSAVRRLWRPAENPPDEGPWTFKRCPVCSKILESGRRLKIMDLATKGEQPFANLVREQFACQPATKEIGPDHPSEGRKSLLFSDGRQKAARLARDLPREVEQDSMREALVLAIQKWERLGQEPVLTKLFLPFISVCAEHYLNYFDGIDQSKLIEMQQRYRTAAGPSCSLQRVLDRGGEPPELLPSFREALLRQLCNKYYSLTAACAIAIQPSRGALMDLEDDERLAGLDGDMVRQAASAWMMELLDHGDLDALLPIPNRRRIFPYYSQTLATTDMRTFCEEVFSSTIPIGRIENLNAAFYDLLTAEGKTDNNGTGRFLDLRRVSVSLALDRPWFRCRSCFSMQVTPFQERCGCCKGGVLDPIPEDDPYLVSRLGFFREPLKAVLAGQAKPFHITAEEHTAQLSQRDASDIYATTEEYELRFQDVPLGADKPPVDVLSCTTTMEVGIDIGSLTAVGLRTVPPQRENYQQRAGRAGRKSTSVSTVLTYAQGGPHDSHYFSNPEAIISGAPRTPNVKSNNRTLAKRHIAAFLLQTFFHREVQGKGGKGAQLQESLGDAKDFFSGKDDFSFASFQSWLDSRVFQSGGTACLEVVSWLPPELAFPDIPTVFMPAFVRETAKTLVTALMQIQKDLEEQAANSMPDDPEREDRLLELLFDKGLLPSYAFPTDLCSFVIQTRDEQGQVVTEQLPQQGKSQALSEYAPGRTLVVNKKTYRVGGIFFSGTPSVDPAKAFFERTALDSYTGCPKCGYVRLEEGCGTKECPVCASTLTSGLYLDPPAFSPEKGIALEDNDSDQELTFATSAQLPEVLSGKKFHQDMQPIGKYLRYACGTGVDLVVVNKGRDELGFSICRTCGAAQPEGPKPPRVTHSLPFLLPRQLGSNRPCSGDLARNVFLGHSFRTDLLLVRVSLEAPIVEDPLAPWLQDALVTLAEALAKGTSLELDIDPGEIAGGFRFLTPGSGKAREAEIFLYDKASGGAGYAFEAGSCLDKILDRTEVLLDVCENHCERSCTHCLRHYGNRFLHERLDRKLAYQLLRFLRNGVVPQPCSLDEQRQILQPLQAYLELEGVAVKGRVFAGLQILEVTEAGSSYQVAAAPSLLRREMAHSLLGREGAVPGKVRVVEEYLIQRDLPTAVQKIRGGSTAGEIHASNSPQVDGVPSGCVQIPSDVLATIGYPIGTQLEITPLALTELSEDYLVLMKHKTGNFKATGEDWTLGKCVRLEGDRIKIRYPARPERQFRPEVVALEDFELVGRVRKVA